MKEQPSLSESLSESLSKIFRDNNIQVEEAAIAKLVSYVELLNKWNKIHNLTAVLDPKEMLSRHILDSLTLLPLLQAESSLAERRMLDVGTGAGLPGIPLSICLPHHQFVLLDKNQKKINFIEHVILALKLKNVLASKQRVQDYHPETLFDWVIARAFASLGEFIEATAHLVKDEGRWIAMKGKLSEAELAALPEGYTIEQTIKLSELALSGERTLIVCKKKE